MKPTVNQIKNKLMEEVLNHPAPTEIYLLHMVTHPKPVINAYNEIGKLLHVMPSTSGARMQFRGRTKIKVKAKVIDGRFTIIKWIDGI